MSAEMDTVGKADAADARESLNTKQARRGEMVTRLFAGNEVLLKELKKEFKSVSVSGFYADISRLSNLWLIRTKGGIRPFSGYHTAQREQMLAAKVDIGRHMVNGCPRPDSEGNDSETPKFQHISRHMGLAVGAGSTALEVCQQLLVATRACSIASNNIALLRLDADLAGDSVLSFVGGEFVPDIMATVGDDAVRGFSGGKVHTGILGVSGIDETGQLYLMNRREVRVMKAMLKNVSTRVFVVASADKLAHEDRYPVATLTGLAKREGEDKVTRQVVLVTNDPNEWEPEIGKLAEDDETFMLDTAKKVFGELCGKFDVRAAPRVT